MGRLRELLATLVAALFWALVMAVAVPVVMVAWLCDHLRERR